MAEDQREAQGVEARASEAARRVETLAVLAQLNSRKALFVECSAELSTVRLTAAVRREKDRLILREREPNGDGKH